MSEREELEKAIAQLEAQSESVGEAAVEAPLRVMRQRLSVLEPVEGDSWRKTPDLALIGERKLVTIMFADVSGFTALSEKMDPESVREIMNNCFERLVPIVANYGGTVDKFIGDEIMALFGAPVAHENDPERALLAALEMKEALAIYSTERGVSLGLHFGINTGSVIAGGIGSRERQEYSVMGDAVNVAKRLEDLSKSGEILVGPDTHSFTAPLFTFESLGRIQVKGRKEPVVVHRLLERKSKIREGRLLSRGISSPLVARDSEFSLLRACLERLSRGQGGVVSVIGEAGLGKSRLMAEVRNSALGDTDLGRVQWLEGRTLSFGQTISYWPFQEILWQYAAITEEDGESAAWRKLGSRITVLFGEKSAEILPYLASLISLEVRGEYAERVKYLDGDGMRRQVFMATRRFFERLAQTRPLVLVFEDLHWVDESSTLLIEHLFPLIESLPLLICGVSRPDPHTPATHLHGIASTQYNDRFTEITLSALANEASGELVNNLLGNPNSVPTALETILLKAEGNPFFLEEIIRSLIDQGVVIRNPATGRWHVEGQVADITIPDTLQGLIMARIDRLDEDVRQVLRTAAVIGRSFLYRILRAISEAGEEVDRKLDELQELELIREKQRMPELEYMFKHALAQEATYESILAQKRRELHRRIGETIESLFGERLEEFSTFLAYHFAKGEAWEKAQEYLFKAGDQAGRVAADAEALAHYRRAFAAYTHAFGDRWDPVQRASLERKIGEALFRLGHHAEATEYLDRSLRYLGNPLPNAPWKMRMAAVAEIIRQIGHRLLPKVFLRPLSASISFEIEEESRVCEIIAWIEAFRNSERFLLSAIKILNVSERVGFAYGIARGSTGVGIMCNLLSIYWVAHLYHRRALAISEQSGHPGAVGLGYLGLANYLNCLARWDAAIQYCEEGAKIYQEIGELRGWGYVTYMKALALARRGDFAEALIRSQEVVTTGKEGADPHVACWGLWSVGHILLCKGRFQEAGDSLNEAMKLAESVQDYVFYITSLHEQGRCYLRQRQLDAALTSLEKAHSFYIEHPTKAMAWLPFRNGLPEAYLAAADRSEADEKVAWLNKASLVCREALKQGKRYQGVLPEAMRLQGTYEWLRGKPRSAQKWWKRSLALAEELKQAYDVGMTLLEMGQRLCDRGHLDRAEAIFSEIGAEWDLERVRFARSCLNT